MLSGVIVHQLDFSFRDVLREDATNADAPGMNVKHDLGCFFLAHTEERFQYQNDEIHRSEIIVQQNHFIKRWPLEFWLRFLNDNIVCKLVIRMLCHLSPLNCNMTRPRLL